MPFRDFISPTAIISDLRATSRDEALLEMIDFLIDRSILHKELRNPLLDALIAREEIASTTIGKGIAVPHAKHPGVSKLTGLVARSHGGLIFKEPHSSSTSTTQIKNPHIDEPVHIFVMLLSNQQIISEHLAALGYVGKFFLQTETVNLIRNAHDEKDIWQFFWENDQKGN